VSYVWLWASRVFSDGTRALCAAPPTARAPGATGRLLLKALSLSLSTTDAHTLAQRTFLYQVFIPAVSPLRAPTKQRREREQ
jgi:hypothetical protein